MLIQLKIIHPFITVRATGTFRRKLLYSSILTILFRYHNDPIYSKYSDINNNSNFKSMHLFSYYLFLFVYLKTGARPNRSLVDTAVI